MNERVNTDVNMSINIEWFINLSNKLDDYFDRINKLEERLIELKKDFDAKDTSMNVQMSNIIKELNDIKTLQAYQIETERKNQVATNAFQLNLQKDATTLKAQLNDQNLNLSYLDDKLTELNTNVTEQFSQLQDLIYNPPSMKERRSSGRIL